MSVSGDVEGPYRPPEAPIAGSSFSAGPMYSPGQIGGATFLGGPLAGAILLRSNYARMLQPRAGQVAIALALVLTLILLAAGASLPERVSRVAIAALIAVGARLLATRLQGDRFEAHLRAGGTRKSHWWVLGVSLACIAITLLVASLAFALFPEWLPAVPET